MEREHWDRCYASSELVWSAAPNRFLVEHTEGLAPGRALDLGCGEGRNAVWLADRGWAVTGVDFSAAGLTKAAATAERSGATVRWERADLRTYAPEAGAFDLVVLLYLHIVAEERRAVQRAAAGALAAGGALLVVGHDRTNLTEGTGGPQDEALLFSPEDIIADLPLLTVERAERVRCTIEPGHGGEGTAVDAVVQLRRTR